MVDANRKTTIKVVLIISILLSSIIPSQAIAERLSLRELLPNGTYFSIPTITFISSDNYNLGTDETTIDFFGLEFQIPESERAQKKEFWYANPTLGLRRPTYSGYFDISYSQSLSSEFGKIGGITTIDWFDTDRFFKRLALGLSDNHEDKNSFISANFDQYGIIFGLTLGIDHLDTWEINASFPFFRSSRMRLAYFDDNFAAPFYRSYSSHFFQPVYRNRNGVRWAPKSVDLDYKIVRRLYDKKNNYARADWEQILTINFRILDRVSLFLQHQNIDASNDYFSRDQNKIGFSMRF